MIKLLEKMLQGKITYGEQKSVIVEAGHIYTNQLPNSEQDISIDQGVKVLQLGKLLGFCMKPWLFIDNYNPQFQNNLSLLDEQAYISSITAKGFIPQKVIYESDLIPQAKEIVDYLLKKEEALPESKTGKVILKKEKILLYNPAEDKYYCSLLDACLYQQKLNESEICITILDQSYASQQKGTKTIVSKLGIDSSKIIPFYYHTPCTLSHESSSVQNVFLKENFNPSLKVKHLLELVKMLGEL